MLHTDQDFLNDPTGDIITYLVYADYLDENDRPEEAESLRLLDAEPFLANEIHGSESGIGFKYYGHNKKYGWGYGFNFSDYNRGLGFGYSTHGPVVNEGGYINGHEIVK